ncbi:ABC transporter permease subunit [Slackia heliotrinireducens]|uniref:ABC transporter permease subunit n=1 Tax=Slackia heliotrinireducens TaxID=84110 RepID=UPI003315DCCB
MATLIRYELKKILGNRPGMVACVLVLLMLVFANVLNLAMIQTRDIATGERIRGAAAVEATAELNASHAGTLDDARVAQDLATFDQAYDLWLADPNLNDLSTEDIIDEYGLEFWRNTLVVIQDPYFIQLDATMTTDARGTRADSLEEGSRISLQNSLDKGYMNAFAYSQAERDYWTDKAEGVDWPIEYGYVGGWSDLMDWTAFLGLAIVAACIAVSGSFASEYQMRTAAVILPTRHGKGRGPVAKAVAAFIFSTVYWWLCVAAICAVYLGAEGLQGAGLPFQVMDFQSPYPLTSSQAVVLLFLMGFVMQIGCTGFTMLLSSAMRSTMPAAVIPMAIVLVGLIVSIITPLAKAAALTPMSALNDSFCSMISYSIGPLVADLPTLAAILYALLAAVCIPLSASVFSKHQVS